MSRCGAGLEASCSTEFSCRARGSSHMCTAQVYQDSDDQSQPFRLRRIDARAGHSRASKGDGPTSLVGSRRRQFAPDVRGVKDKASRAPARSGGSAGQWLLVRRQGAKVRGQGQVEATLLKPQVLEPQASLRRCVFLRSLRSRSCYRHLSGCLATTCVRAQAESFALYLRPRCARRSLIVLIS